MVDLGDGKTRMFFQGLWYHDVRVRTPTQWRISARVGRDYYVHNLPEGFPLPELTSAAKGAPTRFQR